MLVLLKLAFRNVFRYKRRTFITFSAISFGLGLMVVGMSLYNGVDKQTLGNIIDTQTAHLAIFSEGYYEKREELPLDLTIGNPKKIRELLGKVDEIQEVEGRVLFGATVIKGLDELPCLGVGIDTEADPRVFKIKESMKEGSYLESSEQKMLIGSSLAMDLDLKIGDTCILRMFTSTKDFVWNVLDLEIKGIYETENPLVNSQTVFIPLAVAQEGLGIGDEVTEIAVRLKEKSQVEKVKASLQDMLSSFDEKFEIKSYIDLSSNLLEFINLRARYQVLIPLIMLLIATLGIVNTMLMAVYERIREIGMLAAMGMKKIEILLLFIFEGAFIGLFGSLAACIIGGLGGWYIEVKGLDFSALGEEISSMVSSFYPVKDVFYGDLTAGVLLFTLIFGVAVSIIASIYPAYKAVRLDPIEALRHV